MKELPFVLHVSLLAVLLHVHVHQCQHQRIPFDSQHCQAYEVLDEYGNTGNLMRVECTSANNSAGELRTAFSPIATHTSTTTQKTVDLTIRESGDVSDFFREYENPLDHLETLKLDRVSLNEMSLPTLLRKFSSLKELVLNHIDGTITLTKDTFIPGQKINRLTVINGLTDADIDTDAFDNIKETLKELSLRENQLTHLPSAVSGLTHLTDLDLTGNPIKYFSEDHTNLLKSTPNLVTMHVNDVDCQCHLLRESFATYVKEKSISQVVCSPQSKFSGLQVSTIDVEKSCKLTNQDSGPDSSSQIKVAVLALIVTILPLFLK